MSIFIFSKNIYLIISQDETVNTLHEFYDDNKRQKKIKIILCLCHIYINKCLCQSDKNKK